MIAYKSSVLGGALHFRIVETSRNVPPPEPVKRMLDFQCRFAGNRLYNHFELMTVV
ncbi:MAG: hypothetical protein ABIP76_03015 [Verrucomicrobiota bacterium]